MELEILKYGRKALQGKTHMVMAITPTVRKLAEDMLETMYAAKGLGLAAPQVGRMERICVIDIPEESEREDSQAFNSTIAMPLVLINPQILDASGTQRGDEGCLSFPKIYAPVTRAMEVQVQYFDLRYVPQVIVARGLLARALQHEIDHLDGKLFIERLSMVQRAAVAGKTKRLYKANCEEETV